MVTSDTLPTGVKASWSRSYPRPLGFPRHPEGKSSRETGRDKPAVPALGNHVQQNLRICLTHREQRRAERRVWGEWSPALEPEPVQSLQEETDVRAGPPDMGVQLWGRERSSRQRECILTSAQDDAQGDG